MNTDNLAVSIAIIMDISLNSVREKLVEVGRERNEVS
jgi:hypothetical protein